MVPEDAFANLSASTGFFVSVHFMKLATGCPVAFTSRILGGKWKARIVWALVRNEPLRFSEIRRACPPVSDRILTKELRELQKCGLISRHDYGEVPPKTEYSLTAIGNTLRPVMASMADWGLEHQVKIAKRQ
jgi:DNA-binding HxlR family transcriptional regulator